MIKKMSKRQFILLFMTVIASPVIRSLPPILSESAEQAGWLVPVVSGFLLLGIMVLMNELFRKNRGENLVQLCFKILTRPIGTLVAVIYLVWVIALLGFYLRYFGEHITANIMSEASLHFIIIAMLFPVGIVLSKSIVYYARLNEIIFHCFLFVFLVTGLFSIFTKINIENLLPISSMDVVPVLKGSLKGLSVFGYYIFIFFIFDDVKVEEYSLKPEMKALTSVVLLSTLVMLITIGSLGHEAVLRFSDPYFMVVKNVNVLGFLERLDAILLIVWILADFTTITIFAYMAASIINTIFMSRQSQPSGHIKKRRIIVYSVLILSYFTAIYGFKSKFVLEVFLRSFSVPVSVCMAVFLPVLLFVVGKIRKLV